MDTARYTLTEQDNIAFCNLHYRASVPKALLLAAIVISALAALGYAFDGVEAPASIAIGGVIGVAVMLAIGQFIVTPRHAKRAWKDFALIKEPVELTLSQDGFTMVQPSAHVDALWAKMVAWDEDAKVFAIYITRQQAYILPKTQIDGAVVDFARERLIQSGLIARGKRRK